MAFYRIKEAAEKVGVLPHVLRFWESQFPTLKPSKTSRGQRMYSEEDIENFMTIRHLLYSEGYSIAGAKKHLKESKNKSPSESLSAETFSYRESLKDVARELRELKDLVKEI
jgi:DNA-binding transcriptional MerR regulator